MITLMFVVALIVMVTGIVLQEFALRRNTSLSTLLRRSIIVMGLILFFLGLLTLINAIVRLARL